jgi:hypothetical protein
MIASQACISKSTKALQNHKSSLSTNNNFIKLRLDSINIATENSFKEFHLFKTAIWNIERNKINLYKAIQSSSNEWKTKKRKFLFTFIAQRTEEKHSINLIFKFKKENQLLLLLFIYITFFTFSKWHNINYKEQKKRSKNEIEKHFFCFCF